MGSGGSEVGAVVSLDWTVVLEWDAPRVKQSSCTVGAFQKVGEECAVVDLTSMWLERGWSTVYDDAGTLTTNNARQATRVMFKTLITPARS